HAHAQLAVCPRSLHAALPIFRLVFESDLRNEPAVRARFERVERGCFEAITETIMADTGLGRERAELLAAGLIVSVMASKQPRSRSEEHTSELQSRENLVCRLL